MQNIDINADQALWATNMLPEGVVERWFLAEGPHRLTQKRPPKLASSQQSLAAADITNIRHSRDFRCRSVFDFFNTIRQQRTLS
jgi:hypothetical protein